MSTSRPNSGQLSRHVSLPALPSAAGVRQKASTPPPKESTSDHVFEQPVVWPGYPEFLPLRQLFEDLHALWKDIGTLDLQRLSDALSISGAIHACILARKRDREQLIATCEELLQQAERGVTSLGGLFATEVASAARAPLSSRLPALEEVCERISLRLSQVQLLVSGLESMGIDSEWLNTTDVAALESKLLQLKALLLQRRAAALKILALEATEIQAHSDVEFVGLLAAQTKTLEDKVVALRKSALVDTRCAHVIWNELGAAPEHPRDDRVVLLIEGADETDFVVTAPIADEIAQSRSAWESERQAAAGELKRLQAALRVFAPREHAEDFIREHVGVRADVREAYRAEVAVYKTRTEHEEKPLRVKLSALYDEAGLAPEIPKAFWASLDEVAGLEERSRLFAQETQRVETYIKEIADILGTRSELKHLSLAAQKYEAAVRARGAARFQGNSLHLLAEEKFRRRFANECPVLQARLLEDVERWEAEKGEPFIYHGVALGEQLRAIQGLQVALIKAAGDLSALNGLQDVLLQPSREHKVKGGKKPRRRAQSESPQARGPQLESPQSDTRRQKKNASRSLPTSPQPVSPLPATFTPPARRAPRELASLPRGPANVGTYIKSGIRPSR